MILPDTHVLLSKYFNFGYILNETASSRSIASLNQIDGKAAFFPKRFSKASQHPYVVVNNHKTLDGKFGNQIH